MDNLYDPDLYDPETFEIDRFQDFYIEDVKFHSTSDNNTINKDKFFRFKEPLDQWIMQVRENLLLKFINEVPLKDINLIAKQDALLDMFSNTGKAIYDMKMSFLVTQEISIEVFYESLKLTMESFPEEGSPVVVLFAYQSNVEFGDPVNFITPELFPLQTVISST